MRFLYKLQTSLIQCSNVFHIHRYQLSIQTLATFQRLHERFSIVPMNLSKSLNTCASFSNIFDHHIYVLELNGIRLCDTRIYNLSSTHMQTRTHDSRIDIYWSVVIPPFRIDRDTKSAWFPTIRIVEINRGTINS